MRLYRIVAREKKARIELEEAPTPEPRVGEVRIAIEAASLNHRDLLMVDRAADGSLNGRIPVSDGAGRVDAVGPDVTRWQVGDLVATTFFPDWIEGPYQRRYLGLALGGRGADGVLAESVVLPENSLVRAPAHLSPEETSTLPCAAVTAWHGLVARGGMTAESSVVIQGTGGVALFALQFAVAMGARAIVLSSSDAKLARARGMGASVFVNYRQTPDWERVVLEQTDGIGASHVLELGGKATYERSIRALAPAGHIVQIGGLGGSDMQPDLHHVRELNADIHGITVGSAAHFRTMNGFMVEKGIKPVVDRTFEFEQASDAYEHLREGQHFGKIVIRVSNK